MLTRYEAALAELTAQDLYRQTVTYRPLSATEVEDETGRRYVQLSANNYLGLTHEPAVLAAALAAVQQYGSGSGGARLTSGSHPLCAALEAELAAWKGTESALVFNTGYMANVGVISSLVGKGDVIFSDAFNHASIIDGCRLSGATVVVYRHADPQDLAARLAAVPCSGQRLIVTDGVFSMDGDIAPLPALAELARRYQALLCVDDAHAVGVLGGGKGTAAHFGLAGAVNVQIGTLSKALAAEGGYVAGSHTLIAYLRNKARSFIFTTAPTPAALAAAQAALRIIRQEPQRIRQLKTLAAELRQRLQAGGVAVLPGPTPILPLWVGRAEQALALAAQLRQDGLLVSAIRPPTVAPGSSRLRLTVSAAHTAAQLNDAADVIVKRWQEMGLPPHYQEK